MSICVTFVALCALIAFTESNSLIAHRPTNIRSDAIVTTGFNAKPVDNKHESESEGENSNQPGWVKRQLLKFGNMFGSIGNKLGGFTGRVTNALDKLCEVIKTIIPVVAAVCHVGQFQFCGSVMEAPNELANALAPSNIDLSIQD